VSIETTKKPFDSIPTEVRIAASRYESEENVGGRKDDDGGKR
jgi:hypothetical protein